MLVSEWIGGDKNHKKHTVDMLNLTNLDHNLPSTMPHMLLLPPLPRISTNSETAQDIILFHP